MISSTLLAAIATVHSVEIEQRSHLYEIRLPNSSNRVTVTTSKRLVSISSGYIDEDELARLLSSTLAVVDELKEEAK